MHRTSHPGAARDRARRGPLRWVLRALSRTAALAVTAVLAVLLAGFLGSGARALTLPVRVAGDAGLRLDRSVAAAAYPYDRRQAPLDRFGFVAGECTSFAAWWLNAHGVPFGVVTVGPRATGRFLNASTWDGAARAAGWPVGDVPVVGAIAQWHAGETSTRERADGSPVTFVAGKPGHVAVVTEVFPDGTAQWQEYGWGGRAELNVARGTAPRYLYIGVAPPS